MKENPPPSSWEAIFAFLLLAIAVVAMAWLLVRMKAWTILNM